MKKYVVSIITLVLLLNITSCGYFLYPERVGQLQGKIDPTVVVLDAAGLLFGVLPGVVAFAVDLTTGAIYLSTGEKSAIEKHSNRTSFVGDVDLTPVDQNDIVIDQQAAAKKVSILVGKTVHADDVQYFKSEEADSIVAQNSGLSL